MRTKTKIKTIKHKSGGYDSSGGKDLSNRWVQLVKRERMIDDESGENEKHESFEWNKTCYLFFLAHPWAWLISRATGNSRFENAKFLPPAKEKIPENSRSVTCLILHALTQ